MFDGYLLSFALAALVAALPHIRSIMDIVLHTPWRLRVQLPGHLVTMLVVTTSVSQLVAATSGPNRLPSLSTRNRYTVAHSYGTNYTFDKRDGWDTVSVSDLPYKYKIRSDEPSAANATFSPPQPVANRRRRRSPPGTCRKKQPKVDVASIAYIAAAAPITSSAPPPPSTTTSHHHKQKTTSTPAPAPSPASVSEPDGVVDQVSGVIDDLKGVGSTEDVTITWYTGEDLDNPSCWSHPEWTPTDESFVAALTLEGWTSKPECFSFLEMCNGPTKCVFVRVVDSCQGCQEGSKHVDLTKAPFSQLASLDEGKLTVTMRPATQPLEWYLPLWGPQ